MSELSLEAYRFALDNTVDSVVITDISSVIQYVNPAFTTITGFTDKEAVGGKPSILRSRHTTLDTYKDMWSIILSGGWWRGEIINVRKTGEEWYSYLSISQIKDSHGKPFAYVGIAKDITELKRLQFELKEAGLEGIFMLSAAAEAKDELTGSHLRRVQFYSEAIALRLGLSKEAAEEIGYSSMMHDVGKIQIPDNVLKKNGPLSDPEWASMAQHPESGASILRDKPFYAVARDITANHHEKWDGSGYPRGLAGESIPVEARIVALADVFDALTARRPYKEPWTTEATVEHLRAQSGRHFDPDMVEVFIAQLPALIAIKEQWPD